MNDRKILDGQTALVTGADRGIGKGIALELAPARCAVVANYFSLGGLAGRTVRDINTPGGEAFFRKADVSSSSEVEKMFDQVLKRFDQLHILVNNAGIQTWEPLLEVSEFDWDRVIDTNLKGTFLCTQYAAKHMKEYGGGAIVNVGSGCNKLAFPRLLAYTASKGGIEMFTKAAAVELGPYGIRVNCVAPGAIEVERTRQEDPDYAGTWAKLTPLRRVGTFADIAPVVAFLCSDGARFVSGQTIGIDGALFVQAQWPYKT